MSAALSWMIIRNNCNSMLKKRDIKKPFSTEANNLLNLHSYRYNGYVHKRSIGVVPAPDNKGFTVVMKRPKKNKYPAKSTFSVTMKAGPRRSLWKLRSLIKKSPYRRDLLKAALRRASAIQQSQKPKKSQKARAKKAE